MRMRWARSVAVVGCTALLATLGLSNLVGCGDDDHPMFDGGPVYPPASVLPPVAFEGHGRMIVEITAGGANLDGATLEAEDTAAVQIIEQRCRGAVCGAVLRILDTRRNMGAPLPSNIDAQNQFIRVTHGADVYRGLIGVRPLDTIANGSTTPLSVRGTVMASSADSLATSTFAATAGGAPVRWVVYGDATLHGTIDVSGDGATARAGGTEGGAANAMGGSGATGGSGGAPGTASAGAGGGGANEDGLPGEGSDGTPDGGGAGGAGDAHGDAPCSSTFEETSCGTGAGGGATGPGGASGGTFLIATLGGLDLSDATVRALGGDGVEGGGGGGGGNVLIASPSLRPLSVLTATFDVSGGAGGTQAGGGTGGAGGAGRIRIDSVDSAVDPRFFAGPAVDLSAVPAVSDVATMTLTGRAAPSANVSIYEIDDPSIMFDTTADATTGAFSIDVTLGSGLNRLAVTAELRGVVSRSWVGTSFELEQIAALRQALPRGAVIDIVYLP